MSSALPDRRQLIVRLLETRDQHLPIDKQRRDAASSGFVHDTLAPQVCPTCEGANSFGCTGCGGRGSVEVRRHRDPYAVEKVVQYGADGSRHDVTYARDAEIDRLAAQTREPWKSAEDELADANLHPYGWERARQRAYRQYDYGPLDKCLDILRLVDETAYVLLHRVIVYRILPHPREASAAGRVLERGLDFLDGILPTNLRAPEPEKPVRVAGKVERTAGERAFQHRAEEIRRAVLVEGRATVEVAAAWGVSVRQVNRIVQKGEAA